ncbi:GNAT family N-acetyltransferase [Aquirufa sp. ROCK-SH2]
MKFKIFREVTLFNIRQFQIIRHSVKENTISDPNLVSDQDCEEYLTIRGKGWVCEIDYQIIGFAIVDLTENNIWALFIDPYFEKKGVGRKLHQLMLNWYFSQTQQNVWLCTEFNTRAEKFYRKAGWVEIGLHGNKEIKFEMANQAWKKELKY